MVGRSRKKSIVQRIALNVPFNEEHLELEEHHEQATLRRSTSFRNDSKPTTLTVEKSYPLSEKEKKKIWNDHIESYEYDLIIDPKHSEVIYNIPDEPYIQFKEDVDEQTKSCGELLEKTNIIINTLNDLTLKYDNVLKETAEFQELSNALTQEYLQLVDLSSEIEKNLQYFESLDDMQRLLKASGSGIVKKQSFNATLKKLDECLAFCSENPEFKEIELYTIRFRQCMTRALSMIQKYLVEDLKNVHSVIVARLDKKNVNAITNEALLYNEFSTRGEGFKPLVTDISIRADTHKEYSGLLSEVLKNYFRIRGTLLQDSINYHLDQAIANKKETVQFSQDNISYFSSLLTREYDMFVLFFGEESTPELQALDQWFRSLCEQLYDTLRNRIIRETDIESLCQLATLLQKYYEFDDDEFSMVNDSQTSKINYGELYKPILQDVQGRLVFRIQIYVDENIVNYKPKPEDLRIGGRRKSSLKATEPDSSNTPSKKNSVISLNGLDSDYNTNLFKDWYPPLGKAISILSRIYSLVNSVVFDDLAHYIVHISIYCLRSAYDLASVHLGRLDAELYMMQHLILLRNQIQTFDIQYVRSETTLDFSGLTDVFESIRSGTFNSSNLLTLARDSVPKVINNMVDAKFEVQTELRNTVHQFTEDAVNSMIASITKVDCDTVTDDTMKFRQSIEIQLPRLHRQMQIFIQDNQVINFLLDGIQELLIQTYEIYHENLLKKATNEQIQNVMEVDTFIGFLSEIARGFSMDSLKNDSMLNFEDDDDYNVSD